MPELVVSTSGLTKGYGDVLAVDRVDLRVARGKIYGFLGLNGAGKTTTIRLLLGMVRPSAGHANLFGLQVGSDTASLWRRVGHLVEASTAYPELTVRENLEVARQLQAVGRSATARAIERLGPFGVRRPSGPPPVRRQPPATRPGPGARPRARLARPGRARQRPRSGGGGGDPPPAA